MSDKKPNWFARHKVLSGILGIFVLFVIIGVVGGSGADSSKSQTNQASGNNVAQTTDTKAETTAKLNEVAKDGNFEFTVKGVECGRDIVGPNQYAQKTAQGQFCLLTLSVKNVGNQQQLFSESDQKLLNVAKQQYSPDTAATLYHSNNSDVFLSQINPGNTVEGVLVYDIPKDQMPVTAELHDSIFSKGVKVNLQ